MAKLPGQWIGPNTPAEVMTVQDGDIAINVESHLEDLCDDPTQRLNPRPVRDPRGA